MLRQSLLATALALSLAACTPEAEPFDEQISDDVTISDITVTALDGADEGQRSYEISYTLSNDTGERIWLTERRTRALLPDAQDSQTVVLMDDFPPVEEDNTSYAPPAFKVDLLEPGEALSQAIGIDALSQTVGVDPEDPLLDLPFMRVCVAFFRESSRGIDFEPLQDGWITQSLGHSWREVACSPEISIPAATSD